MQFHNRCDDGALLIKLLLDLSSELTLKAAWRFGAVRMYEFPCLHVTSLFRVAWVLKC